MKIKQEKIHITKNEIETVRKAFMNIKKHVKRAKKIRAKNPDKYKRILDMVRKQFRDAERDYTDKLKEEKEEIQYYWDEPFGYFPRENKCALLFSDFSNILKILNFEKRDKRILDLGCGSGWLAIFLAKLKYESIGMDISPKKIKLAKEKAKINKCNAKFYVKDAENFEFEKKFDAIIIYATLHHVLNEKKCIKNCFKNLKEGGKLLIIGEPDLRHPVQQDVIDVVNKYGTIEKGYTREHICKILKKSGFKKIKCFELSRTYYEAKIKGLLNHLCYEIAKNIYHKISKLGAISILAEK